MTWHLSLYAAISYSDAQPGAKFGTMCQITQKKKKKEKGGMCAERGLPSRSVKQ